MNQKPMKPYAHGISDYLFGMASFLMPAALGLNKKTKKTYRALGAGLITFNALTETSPCISPVFSIRQHKKYDEANILLLAVLSGAKFIRQDKKTLAFHLFYLASAVTNYALTDYSDDAAVINDHER